MEDNHKLIVGAALVAAVGGGAYYLSKHHPQSMPTSVTTVANTAPSVTDTGGTSTTTTTPSATSNTTTTTTNTGTTITHTPLNTVVSAQGSISDATSIVSLLATSGVTLSVTDLNNYFGIGNTTPAGASFYMANAFWQGVGVYDFGAASFITPYLTSEHQLNDWNWILYQTIRVDNGVTQPVDAAIQLLSASQCSVISGNTTSGNSVGVLTTSSSSNTPPPTESNTVTSTVTNTVVTSPQITVSMTSATEWTINVTGITANSSIIFYTIITKTGDVALTQVGVATAIGTYTTYGTSSPNTYSAYIIDNTTGAQSNSVQI